MSLLLGPTQLSRNGAELAGGTLFFSISGTDTKKAIFLDPDNTIDAANPITLDSQGFSPIIFSEDDVPYRMTVFRADGTQYKQFNNLVGVGFAVANASSWEPSVAYNFQDIKQGSDSNWYQSIIPGTGTNTGNDPVTTPTAWTLITFTKEWNPDESYIAGILVSRLGPLFLSRVPTTGDAPENSPTEWANVSGIGLQPVYFSAAGMVPSVAAGPELVDTTRGIVFDKTFNFDDTVEEFVQITIGMPPSWDGGALNINYDWSSSSGDLDNVEWKTSVVTLTDGTDVAAIAVFEDTQNVIDINQGSSFENVTATVVLTPTVTTNTVIVLEISRVTTASNLSGDARLHGLFLTYTSTSSVD